MLFNYFSCSHDKRVEILELFPFQAKNMIQDDITPMELSDCPSNAHFSKTDKKSNI